MIILWCRDRRSYLVTADLSLKFKGAEESSGPKFQGFVVLENGSLAFSRRFLQGDWSEVPGNVKTTFG